MKEEFPILCRVKSLGSPHEVWLYGLYDCEEMRDAAVERLKHREYGRYEYSIDEKEWF